MGFSTKFVAALIGLSIAAAARGESANRNDQSTNPFTKSYVQFELIRNFPEAFTQHRMSAGDFEPSITYLHTVNGNWMMGFGGQLKVFNRGVPDPVAVAPSSTTPNSSQAPAQDQAPAQGQSPGQSQTQGQNGTTTGLTTDPNVATSRTLAIYSLSHDTYYVLRLSHPTYLFMGTKLLYLLPALTGKPPPQRDTDYQPEIGAALSAQIARVVDDRWIITLRLDRWRGLNTSRLAGIEVALGICFAWEHMTMPELP